MLSTIPKDILEGNIAEFRSPVGRHLLDRWIPFQEWWEKRFEYGLDPYCRSTNGRITPQVDAFDRKGNHIGGKASINFASQEYLNLAAHPAVLDAAQDAVRQYGVHSAGAAVLMGVSAPLLDLEKQLAKFLNLADVSVFPTGWNAGYGIIETLLTPNDYIVIDKISHACLIEGAVNGTKNVHFFRNNDTDHIERILQEIRSQTNDAGILLVTEALFSMDSTIPDIRKVQSLAREYGATLVLDVAHDLGSLGEFGGGALEMQNMVGQVDIVMGSFSKTFASNGGFVASNHPALRQLLRPFCGTITFTNAFSPVQAATVLKTLEIIQSAEGKERRVKLMQNVLQMRGELEKAGFTVLGEPSAIIPIVLGDTATARLMTKHLFEQGMVVNLVEFPAVSRNTNRWRAQMMSEHTPEQISAFVKAAIIARDAVKQYFG